MFEGALDLESWKIFPIDNLKLRYWWDRSFWGDMNKVTSHVLSDRFADEFILNELR